MKTILLLFLMMPLFSTAHCQLTRKDIYQIDTSHIYLPEVKGEINYTATINDPGFNKMQLYDMAKIFIGHTFNNAKDVIMVDDRDQGDILVNAIINGDYPSYTTFTFRIQVKDGKYRYKLSNYVYHGKPVNYTIDVIYDYPLEKIESQFNSKDYHFKGILKKAFNKAQLKKDYATLVLVNLKSVDFVSELQKAMAKNDSF